MAELARDRQPVIRQIGVELVRRGLRLCCAESCTGGLVAASITAVPGSSEWFDRGFVAYSNESKGEMLSVSAQVLASHGSVSEPAVVQMAIGAVAQARAGIALAISGVAGPGGGSAEKPVGTVCLAWYLGAQNIQTETQHFDGDRESIREQSVFAALDGLSMRLGRLPT